MKFILLIHLIPILLYIFYRVKFIYFTNKNNTKIYKNFHKWNKFDIILILTLLIPIYNYIIIIKVLYDKIKKKTKHS
jgi:hypothetical protein